MDLRRGLTSRLLPSLLTRLGSRVLALIAAVTVLLLMLRAAPGDAVDLITQDELLRSRMTRAWDLDAPLPVAVSRALSGDWGTSWTVRPGQSVRSLLSNALWSSLPLLTGAFSTMVLAGLALGTRDRTPRWSRPSISVLPIFLLGWALVVGLNEATFAAMQSGILERPSWFSLPDTPSWLRSLLAVAVLAVGSGNVRAFSQGVRHSLGHHRSSPAVEALEARGMPFQRVLWRLMFADLTALTAERAVYLFGGLVVLERVFSMPGLGSLFFEACIQRDQPVVLASGVLAAVGVMSVRLFADGLRLVADPRLRDPA